jgi:hypothetical protein
MAREGRTAWPVTAGRTVASLQLQFLKSLTSPIYPRHTAELSGSGSLAETRFVDHPVCTLATIREFKSKVFRNQGSCS